jgi:6-phosphogluconolactonase (cycloisomerase 2 family)
MLTGCGEFFSPVNNGSGGGTGSTTYVYVTNVSTSGTGGTITAYSLTSGVLTALSGSPITLSGTPNSIVVAPNNAFLYVGTDLGVFLYTIGTDGTLTEGNNSTVVYVGPTQPISVAVDSTSSWLLVADQPTAGAPNTVEVDAIPVPPTTGIPPSQSAYSVTMTAAGVNQMIMAPANNNLFLALGANGTEAIGFNAASTATPFGSQVAISPHNKGGVDSAVAVDPTSAYLYATEAPATATTSAAANILRVIPVSNLSTDTTYQTGIGPSAILADPTGAYVYVTNNNDNTITGFSTTASTTSLTLAALSGSPFPTGKAPAGIAEDSTKSYILEIGSGASPNLWLYNFDATTAGTLDIKATTSTASTGGKTAIALSH